MGYQIGLDDGAVHQLLKLDVGEVAAHHHLQNCEQLPVAYVSILVDIVDLECELDLFVLVVPIERGQTYIPTLVPVRNYLKEIFPSLLMSKTAITLCTRGFWFNYATLKISFGSKSPLESESIYKNRA